MMNAHTAETAVASSSDPHHSMDPSWHRPRRGSLPLKKRRLADLYDEPPSWESPMPPKSFDSSSLRTISFGGNGDEQKIAALALVAAAATARASEPLFTASLSNIDYSTSMPNNHHIIQDELMHDGMFHVAVTPEQQHQPRSLQRSSSSSSDDNANGNKRQRVNHPPLSSPLPNGCHGRTSRNNSYCRRQPRYNGSKYCKLHYQHYVVAGKAAADPSPSSSGPEAPCGLVESVAAIEKGGEHSAPTAHQQQQHQDKRFTGHGDETRCQATTTRGRACAYVSVNGTRYCYLHADYDVNPPPRRGGCNTSGGQKTKADASNDATVVRITKDTAGEESVRSESSFETPPPHPRTTMAAALAHTSPPSVTSEESSCASTGWTAHNNSNSGNRSGTKKTAKAASNKVSSSGRPLLSSISSEQWFDKPVMISTGPLANQTGRVVKWGNGWVTVRIGKGVDGLTHNRRSVELLLLPDDHKENEEGEDPQVTTAEDETENELCRVVSRESDAGKEPTPPLSLVVPENPTIHQASVSEGTEETDQRLKERETTVSPDGTIPASEGTATRRESTPVQEQQEAHNTTGETPSAAAPAPQLVTPKPPSPMSGAQASSADEKSVPLLDSLIAAQQGRGSRKYNLDLLFGTAALERSRRKIHKPTRYEDTAMLEKKRGRLHSEGVEDSTTPKRRRQELSPRSTKKLSSHSVPSSPRNRAFGKDMPW